MDTIKVNLVRNLINLFSFISLIFQLMIFKNSNDFFCILIIFFSNIITTSYCLNNKYFFNYPITLLMIFISHFINLGGALFLKSLEFSLITENLKLPLSTILILTAFNITIILSHLLYRRIKFPRVTNTINKFLTKNHFYDIQDINFLYFLSVIAILTKIFYFDLNTKVSIQSGFGEDASILKDITNGFRFLIFMPIIIFFSKSLYNIQHIPKKNIFFLLSFLSVALISFSRNNRSILFDFVFLIILILFILFLFNKINFERRLFIKYILILVLFISSFNFLENLSTSYINERSQYTERTPLENVKIFVDNFFLKKENNLYLKKKYLSQKLFFAENYYSSTIFNRANVLLIHDNFNYIKKNMSNYILKDIKALQINKFISIFPQPLINIFTNSFDKNKYMYSTASYLYEDVEFGYGGLNIGSALMTLYIIFGQWVYVLLFLFFIPIFIFFDSFYDKKTMVFSPYIIIFFFSTSGGILNFVAATEISFWITFLFRIIPQTFIMIIIAKFVYNFLFKKY